MYRSCDQTQSWPYILLRIPMIRQEGGSGFQTAGHSRDWDRGGTLVLKYMGSHGTYRLTGFDTGIIIIVAP